MGVLSRLRLAAQPLAAQLRRASSRGYGSAAAFDYDYYYDHCEDETTEPYYWNKKSKQTMEESEVWIPRRGVQWVIIGDPMAKRHVYAEKLSKLLDVPYISMGTLVCQELDPHSSLYKQIANALNEGKLVSEHVIFGLLSKRLDEGYSRGENGFILDGIPRTRVQAEILDQVADIDLVINLKCTEECLHKRYTGNGISSFPRELFGMGGSRFSLGLESPDGNLEPSSADTHAIWKEKYRTYAEQKKALEDYYRKQKKLLDFEVAGAPGESWQGLLAALHLQHMNAICASHKLSA